MTDYSALIKPDKGQPARALQLVDSKLFDEWLKAQPERHRAAVAAQKFTGKGFELAILPGEKPDQWSAVLGVADVERLSSWCLAKGAEVLPEGTYRVEGRQPGPAMFGWLTAQYRFDRYKKAEGAAGPRILLTTELPKMEELLAEAEATALVRDLVNTPTADMGPPDLQAQVERIAKAFHAKVAVTRGEDLEDGYPMIHAVGRAAHKDFAPRLIELKWGNAKHPRIAIVGKGVCFDSGGLDIKPSSGMRLMKKDMGGAAHALGLARLIMGSRLPVHLHLLVPAVENAIGSNAFRPGDILKSRKGISVEIGNTDAEGRLVLADALTKAGEEEPELIIDFATLTGAARVALGPDLPGLFSNDDGLARELMESGDEVDDPVWHLPLWSAYADMLKSDIADINNAGEGGMAGATTAALFLQKFVPEATKWAHFDTFAWRPAGKPGRPKGGDALGMRAAWALMMKRYGKQG